VTVHDNGTGGARVRAASGLAGLSDRLEALDATLAITSEPGQGSTISAVFPCAS
jgi:signal transduction histidine kinase